MSELSIFDGLGETEPQPTQTNALGGDGLDIFDGLGGTDSPPSPAGTPLEAQGVDIFDGLGAPEQQPADSSEYLGETNIFEGLGVSEAPPAPSQQLTRFRQQNDLSPTDALIKPPPSPSPATSLQQAGAAPPSGGTFRERLGSIRDRLATMPQDDPQRASLMRRGTEMARMLSPTETPEASGLEKFLLPESISQDPEATIQALAPIQNQLQQTVGGITFGLSDVVLEKMRDKYGLEYNAQSTSEQVINSLGRMLGTVFTAQGLAKGMRTLIKDLGLKDTKLAITTRLGTAGIASTINALSNITTGKRDAKDAAGDIAQSLGAALVGFGAETGIGAGVKNWFGQVGADLVYDIVTDIGIRDRLKDQSFKEWFITEELPQLAMSIAFATKDLTDANFEKQRVATVNELKQNFNRRFKASDVYDPKLSEQIASEIDVGRLASSVREAATKLGDESYPKLIKEARDQGVVGKKEAPDKSEIVTRLSEKAIETARRSPLVRASQGDENVLEFVRGMEENEKIAEAKAKKEAETILEYLEKQLVDQQGAVKRALTKAGAKRAAERLVVRQGASGQAAEQYRIAESKIDKALGGTSEELLSDIIHARRTVEATEVARSRGTELKTPELIGEKNSRAVLRAFENMDAPPKAELQAALNEFDAFNRSSLDQLRDAGLISEAAHAKLIAEHKFYSPRVFIDSIDPETSQIRGQRGHDSGVKALGEGSDAAMETDFKRLMAHVAARTQNRVFRNKASQELLRFAESEPDNEVVRVRGTFPDGTKMDIGKTEAVVTVFREGQQVEMVMPKKLAEQWEGLPAALSDDVARDLQKWTGTALVKTLATGINPEFALRNIVRDAQYAWFVSGQYSHFLPKGALQQIADYSGVLKDGWKAKGGFLKATQQYKDYVAQGGGLDYLTTQGAIGQKTLLGRINGAKNTAEKIGNLLGWLGETSEIATRLAVRNRAMKNGVSAEEATYIARNMLDFAQGGRAAKALDNTIPYLNAAILGTRGGMGAFKTDPVGTSFKAAQLATMGYGLAAAAQAIAPEIWNSISQEEKARKWVIPLPFKKKDKRGLTRGMYISIPKDQFQQVFSAVGQSIVDGMNGRPWGTQITESLASAFPVEASGLLPPIGNAAAAYFYNYDTWRNQEIWSRYSDVSPSNEVRPTTPHMARQIAEGAKAMNIEISPERLSTATSKLIPTSNPIMSGLVDLYHIPFTEKDEANFISQIRAVPGLRSFLRFSLSINPRPKTIDEARRLRIDTEGKIDQDLRREIDEAKREKADIKAPVKLGMDELLNRSVESEEVIDYIKKNAGSQNEARSLLRRAKSRRPEIFK